MPLPGSCHHNSSGHRPRRSGWTSRNIDQPRSRTEPTRPANSIVQRWPTSSHSTTLGRRACLQPPAGALPREIIRRNSCTRGCNNPASHGRLHSRTDKCARARVRMRSGVKQRTQMPAARPTHDDVTKQLVNVAEVHSLSAALRLLTKSVARCDSNTSCVCN